MRTQTQKNFTNHLAFNGTATPMSRGVLIEVTDKAHTQFGEFGVVEKFLGGFYYLIYLDNGSQITLKRNQLKNRSAHNTKYKVMQR